MLLFAPLAAASVRAFCKSCAVTTWKSTARAPAAPSSSARAQWSAGVPTRSSPANELRAVNFESLRPIEPAAAEDSRAPPSSADFQVCRIADFPIRAPSANPARSVLQRPADLEVGDTADWEICATVVRHRANKGVIILKVVFIFIISSLWIGVCRFKARGIGRER